MFEDNVPPGCTESVYGPNFRLHAMSFGTGFR